MSGELIFRPRRGGKRNEARQRIFDFVAVGDTVALDAAEGALRYEVFEKRQVDDELLILVCRQNRQSVWREWEIDPAAIRLVFEGTK